MTAFTTAFNAHLSSCSTRRLLLERLAAILSAPTDDEARALAEKAAPIDDLPEHVRTLIILLLMFTMLAHIQNFSSIYAAYLLKHVRCYEAEAVPNCDEHNLYLRFDALILPLNTLENLRRVSVAVGVKQREKHYTPTEETGSVRVIYLCTGSTIHIYLMEALLIWLCKLY